MLVAYSHHRLSLCLALSFVALFESTLNSLRLADLQIGILLKALVHKSDATDHIALT